MNINPILKLDYPDVDVIRVGDIYYMVSTTMYFFPGCEILKSHDLINWEHASFVYDTLDGTAASKLDDKKGIYGKGMWAASLRFHEGTFYVVFVCNDTKRTYLYQSSDINGPWHKSYIDGFYHDASLLFDNGKVYIAYGNREIHLTELNDDLSAPKPGGLNRIILKDSDKTPLGYEGTHLYKINGKYYAFFIHSLEDRWMRAEACFVADSLDGEFKGGDIFVNDLGYCNMGIAQGGIVDTPDGRYYAILFQDMGAVGRIPYVLPMHFENDYPVIEKDTEQLLNPSVPASGKAHKVKTLLSSSDNFKHSKKGPSFGLSAFWQFNHEPDTSAFILNNKKGTYTIISHTIAGDLVYAKNTITQRLYYPGTHVEVTLDASHINEGDYAGLCVLQSLYAYVAVTREKNEFYMVMHENELVDGKNNEYILREKERIKLDSPKVTLHFDADFTDMKDTVSFNIGPEHKMYFRLDHFTGNRAGLFLYSTKYFGGSATFSDFILTQNI